jgi:ABC-type dipeptide/oligopeptide/nickel transport system permease subunit
MTAPTVTGPVALESPERPRRQRVRLNALIVAGGAMVLLFIAVAIIGKVRGVSPLNQTADFSAAPSASHWFGTDSFGRDLFARSAAGAVVSLEVAVGSVLVGLVIGVPVGMIAGYFPTTWIDESVMRIVDVVLALPLFILAIAVLGFLGTGPMHIAGVQLPAITSVVALIGIAAVPVFARVARSCVLVEREEDYVDALKVVGVSRMRILFGDVLLNVIPPVMVQATAWMAVAVFSEAGLSYLGLGIQPPAPTLGNILYQAQGSLLLGQWWEAVLPGLLIFLVIAGFNLLGDGIAQSISTSAN